MEKIRRLRNKLSRLRLGGMLVTDLTNVRYLCGFTGSSGFLIATPGDALFVTDFRYQEQAGDEVRGCPVRIEYSERSRELKNICKEYGIRRLGFEDHHVAYAFYRKLLRQKIPVRPVSHLVESFRVVKSDSEFLCIRKAVRRAEAAFRRLLPSVRTGVTERYLARKLEDLLKEQGCKRVPFDIIVASGPASALPHAKPTPRRLRKGDFVMFDWGGECDGYYSDMTRTVLIKGRDLVRQKQIYHCVLAAQQRAISAVKAGIHADVVDAAARNYIKKAGFGDFFGHGTGHGVGLAVHEKPVVSWRSTDVLRSRMVFTVEPGIYVPGFGGVRIEDMVTINGSRGVVLTSLPKKLRIIER